MEKHAENDFKDNISRRSFLQKTTAAVAAYTMVKPAQVCGTQANSRIKIGVIGMGWRGSWIADLLDKHPGFEVSAVCDYFQKRADTHGDKLKVPKNRRFSGLMGYQRLLDSGVDAVALETPPYCFPDHATAAVNAGCHVYMAKPVATDVPGCLQIKKMGKLATQKNQAFIVDFQMRVDPYLIECVKRVRQGALKDMLLINTFYHDEGFADPPLEKTIENRLVDLIWCADDELGAGYFVNAGIHAVDAALWIAGKLPVSCMGASTVTRPNAHGNSQDSFSMTYQFSGDRLIMNYSGEHVNNLSDFRCGCDVFGVNDMMEARYATGKSWIHGGKLQYRGGATENLYIWAPEQNINTFYNDITKGKFDNPTVETSVNSNLACILGREAAARRTTITWDQLIKENKKHQGKTRI